MTPNFSLHARLEIWLLDDGLGTLEGEGDIVYTVLLLLESVGI